MGFTAKSNLLFLHRLCRPQQSSRSSPGGSEAGSYLRLIDFVYHSTLGLMRVIKKRKKKSGWGGVRGGETIWPRVCLPWRASSVLPARGWKIRERLKDKRAVGR